MTRRKQKEQERTRQMKMHSRSKMCGKKKAYPTEIEANGYAKMYSDPRYGKSRGVANLRTYLCPLCDKWHLTSHERKERKLLTPTELYDTFTETIGDEQCKLKKYLMSATDAKTTEVTF